MVDVLDLLARNLDAIRVRLAAPFSENDYVPGNIEDALEALGTLIEEASSPAGGVVEGRWTLEGGEKLPGGFNHVMVHGPNIERGERIEVVPAREVVALRKALAAARPWTPPFIQRQITGLEGL